MNPIAHGTLAIVALAAIGVVGLTAPAQAGPTTAPPAPMVKSSRHAKGLCGTDDPALRRPHKPVLAQEAAGLTAARAAEVNTLLDMYNAENQKDYSDSHISCNAGFERMFGPDLAVVVVSVGQAEATYHHTLLFEVQQDHVGAEPIADAAGRVDRWVDLNGDGEEEWIFADHHHFAIARWDRSVRKLVNLGIEGKPELNFESSQDTLDNCPYTDFTYRIDAAAKPFPVVRISTFFRDNPSENGTRQCAPHVTRTDLGYQWDPARQALAKISEQKGREAPKNR
jgi:hypothetical protein